MRKSEEDEGSTDEEEVPRSPLKVLAHVEAEPANTQPKVTTYYSDSWVLYLKGKSTIFTHQEYTAA